MAIVFRFNSMDPRQRATLAFPNVAAATAHLAACLRDGARWTLDEDGEETPDLDALTAALSRGEPVTLHDQDGVMTDDRLELLPA